MLHNLRAELTRNQISPDELGRTIGKSGRSTRDKINGITAFTFPEALKIRNTHFPEMRLEYLFADIEEAPDIKQ